MRLARIITLCSGLVIVFLLASACNATTSSTPEPWGVNVLPSGSGGEWQIWPSGSLEGCPNWLPFDVPASNLTLTAQLICSGDGNAGICEGQMPVLTTVETRDLDYLAEAGSALDIPVDIIVLAGSGNVVVSVQDLAGKVTRVEAPAGEVTRFSGVAAQITETFTISFEPIGGEAHKVCFAVAYRRPK